MFCVYVHVYVHMSVHMCVHVCTCVGEHILYMYIYILADVTGVAVLDN